LDSIIDDIRKSQVLLDEIAIGILAETTTQDANAIALHGTPEMQHKARVRRQSVCMQVIRDKTTMASQLEITLAKRLKSTCG
jgi:hypothetical protein